MTFHCRFPGSCPAKNTWVISAFCFHYINKYLVTLSEQWLVPGSKVLLSLVKCCMCCPLKLLPEHGLSPLSESRVNPPHTSTDEAGTCSWRWGTTGGITSHWWKMELGFKHETTAQVSRGWETGGSVMSKVIKRNHSDYFLHEGIDWPRRWGMSIAASYWYCKKLQWQVVRLAHIVEEGRDPSLQWKDNSEGKEETSMLRNITPRLVCFSLLSAACCRAELQEQDTGPGQQCQALTTLERNTFSMGTGKNTLGKAPWHFLPSAPTWHVTVTLPRRHKCQQLSQPHWHHI